MIVSVLNPKCVSLVEPALSQSTPFPISRRYLLARVLWHGLWVEGHDGAGGVGHGLDGFVEITGYSREIKLAFRYHVCCEQVG